ncbi:MAG: S8 family serine peptidase [Bacteroidales bacterium]|jgi:subtilisin family serine protease|nr:S8 family serine peptidase [Bacteroidales bacterium]
MKLFLFLISISFVIPGFTSLEASPSKREKKKQEKQRTINWLAQYQTARMGAEYFKQENLTGKGIRIAVFDAGFKGVDKHPAFDHIRENIVATYDFTKNSENVYRKHWHGTAVLSNIAGKMGDIPLGLAPEAEFLLVTIENPTPSVLGFGRTLEENWIRAIEWAHQNGANIITASLGYNIIYLPENMDGQTSLVSKVTKLAAEKGILLINSAGNSGTKNDKFKVITTPADADHVLTVGGIDPKTEVRSGFSSYGPSADGRLKPNVTASSITVAARQSKRDSFRIVSGTSFSTPLVAGFAACVWQAHPHLKAAEIFKLIEQSSELYPYYVYAPGYGVPNARYFDENTPKPSKFFDFVEENDTIRVEISKDILPQLEKSTIFRLYYHLQKPNGMLSEYAVIDVFQKTALIFPKEKLEGIKQISVHFLGYTQTYEIE